MHIPGRRKHYPNALRAGPSPKMSLIEDLLDQVAHRGLVSVKHARVAVLPEHPRRQQGEGVQPFAHRLSGHLPGLAPPVVEGGVVAVRRLTGHAESSQHLVPNLSREGAGEDEMVHGLRHLVAEEAAGMVLEASPGKALGSPAAIHAGKPSEKLDPRRRPRLPSKLPGAGGSGAMELRKVARLGGVSTTGSPLPDQPIRLSAERGARNGSPERQVLANLVHAEGGHGCPEPRRFQAAPGRRS